MPYISKAEVLALAQKIKSDLVLADITDFMMNASTEIIDNRTRAWAVSSAPQYIDGRGENSIFCPLVPIVSLTGLIIIASDATEESLDIAGADREVWYNEETGLIKRISADNNIAKYPDGFADGPLFPEGVKNIKLIGQFGKGPYNVLYMLQTALIFQMLRFIYPASFNQTDLVMEKIGDYEYRVGDMQYSKDPLNQKKTLEGYIEWLFQQLPRNEYTDMVLAI